MSNYPRVAQLLAFGAGRHSYWLCLPPAPLREGSRGWRGAGDGGVGCPREQGRGVNDHVCIAARKRAMEGKVPSHLPHHLKKQVVLT
jgi:hypothetical protein